MSVLATAEALLEECHFAPERLPHAMEQAGRLLGFDYFCLVAADLEQATFIASEEQRAGIAAYFSGGWAEVDYRARTEPRHPLGEVYLDHREVSVDERVHSAVYNELYRPLKMSHYAGIRFNFGGAEWFCSASRAENKGEIDGSEAGAFTRLARTAIKVASLAARLQHAHASGLIEGLASSGTAAVILNQDGCVGAVTPMAERLFGGDFGVRNRVLWSANATDAHALAGLALSARRGDRQLADRHVLIRGEARRHPVLITASLVLGVGLDALPGARVVLLLSDLGERDTKAPGALNELFDLSPTEAQVATMIADGLKIAQIAARRHVSPSTIRAQVKSIFRKMEINRQAELMRILARLRG